MDRNFVILVVLISPHFISNLFVLDNGSLQANVIASFLSHYESKELCFSQACHLLCADDSPDYLCLL
jgi:hypothetical protein